MNPKNIEIAVKVISLAGRALVLLVKHYKK